MKILQNLIFAAFFLFNYPNYIEGAFNLSGSFSGPIIQISARTLKGNGTICSPKVKINCDEFQYTGTIYSDGECVIRTKKAFDYSCFKREGSGKFTVIVSPYDIENHTRESLINKSRKKIFSNYLSLDKNQIIERIQEIRCNAFTNNIDEKSIISIILSEIERGIAYHSERIGQKTDNSKLPSALIAGGVGLAGLALSIKGIVNLKSLSKRLGVKKEEDVLWIPLTLGIASICYPILMSLDGFLSYLEDPKHQERSEQLKLIKGEINEIILTPFKSQQEVIHLQ